MIALAGRLWLLTGGSAGEKLVLEHGVRLHVLPTDYARASRVARFEVALLRGDVVDHELSRSTAGGCDVIIHCAYGPRSSDRERRRVNGEGTRSLLDAALATPARMVGICTMVVYGIGIESRLHERAPCCRISMDYADTQREAEALAPRYASAPGDPAAAVQPSSVDGPFGPDWTGRVAASVRCGRVTLVDGGTGLVNPVYIEDVADALLIAVHRNEASGQGLLIASGPRLTWREFCGRYEAMLGIGATVDLTRSEAKTHYARSQRRRYKLPELLAPTAKNAVRRRRLHSSREPATVRQWLRPLARQPAIRPLVQDIRRRRKPASTCSFGNHTAVAPPTKRIQLTHPKQVGFLAAKTTVSISLVRQLRGYWPAYGLDRDMVLTAAYLRWAGMLPCSEARCD